MAEFSSVLCRTVVLRCDVPKCGHPCLAMVLLCTLPQRPRLPGMLHPGRSESQWWIFCPLMMIDAALETLCVRLSAVDPLSQTRRQSHGSSYSLETLDHVLSIQGGTTDVVFLALFLPYTP